LAGWIRSRGSKANRTTDSSVFSINEARKAEGEIRKSEIFFLFQISAFGPRTPAPGPSRLRLRPEPGRACAQAFRFFQKSL